jgi:hypothetical protein
MVARFKMLTTRRYVDAVKAGVWPPFDRRMCSAIFANASSGTKRHCIASENTSPTTPPIGPIPRRRGAPLCAPRTPVCAPMRSPFPRVTTRRQPNMFAMDPHGMRRQRGAGYVNPTDGHGGPGRGAGSDTLSNGRTRGFAPRRCVTTTPDRTRYPTGGHGGPGRGAGPDTRARGAGRGTGSDTLSIGRTRVHGGRRRSHDAHPPGGRAGVHRADAAGTNAKTFKVSQILKVWLSATYVLDANREGRRIFRPLPFRISPFSVYYAIDGRGKILV